MSDDDLFQVTVLEAQDRLGGRVDDNYNLGLCVGRGAQIIGGCTNNPIALLCHQVTLRWCHNECDGDSNHRSLHCLLNCLFRRRSKKASKLRVTGLCEGNSPVTGEFPAQRASNAENVSIWWRHHELHVTGVVIMLSVFPNHLKRNPHSLPMRTSYGVSRPANHYSFRLISSHFSPLNQHFCLIQAR